MHEQNLMACAFANHGTGGCVRAHVDRSLASAKPFHIGGIRIALVRLPLAR